LEVTAQEWVLVVLVACLVGLIAHATRDARQLRREREEMEREALELWWRHRDKDKDDDA
jgi:cbb3-type cytochrome oxidase subunit 3